MSAKIVAGSVKNKIMSSDLQEEREKCAFDSKEMEILMGGGPEQHKI